MLYFGIFLLESLVLMQMQRQSSKEKTKHFMEWIFNSGSDNTVSLESMGFSLGNGAKIVTLFSLYFFHFMLVESLVHESMTSVLLGKSLIFVKSAVATTGLDFSNSAIFCVHNNTYNYPLLRFWAQSWMPYSAELYIWNWETQQPTFPTDVSGAEYLWRICRFCVAHS